MIPMPAPVAQQSALPGRSRRPRRCGPRASPGTASSRGPAPTGSSLRNSHFPPRRAPLGNACRLQRRQRPEDQQRRRSWRRPGFEAPRRGRRTSRPDHPKAQPGQSLGASPGNRSKTAGTELQEPVSRGAAPHPAKGQGPLDLQYSQGCGAEAPRKRQAQRAR